MSMLMVCTQTQRGTGIALFVVFEGPKLATFQRRFVWQMLHAFAFTFYEFFAGGGMVRAGLGPGWKCLFANDFDFKKSAVYRENWGDGTIATKDVGSLEVSELPGRADLIWASFPCQDLSLAGMGAGLRGDRSGAFWPFWTLVKDLKAQGRGPRIVVLENVCGTLTSHAGRDFTTIADALAGERYRFGAVVVDAVEFVPQSRPRLFIIAIDEHATIHPSLLGTEPSSRQHTRALRNAYVRLTDRAKQRWIWWRLPGPHKRTVQLADLVEENPASVAWHTPEKTARLLAMMSAANTRKISAARRAGRLLFGAIYKRTRPGENGIRVQRAEVRFDGIAGCLRTPTGGSSRQVIVVVKGKEIRSRLISSRETARLMGLPDDYRLPNNYNEAYHLTGDGVVVPVVRYLAKNLLELLLTEIPGLTGDFPISASGQVYGNR